jgi:hypothetical protein
MEKPWKHGKIKTLLQTFKAAMFTEYINVLKFLGLSVL